MTWMSWRITHPVRTLIGGFLFAAIWLIISYNTIIQDSPAPGCVKRLAFSEIGWCKGRTAIIDLEVTSAPRCLDIKVNNCHGGVLEVRNRCNEVFVLGGFSVEPDKEKTTFFEVITRGDEYFLAPTFDAFTFYIPRRNMLIEAVGTLGDQAITVRFTKTKLLCI
ncbi:hypothetical protein A6A03_07755 [Chloroflexus islandicus]|uniref:Uncharacterized protein n=1 Tax=Chloroflexus islandicus TaxID=1707952 RepID=A0A178MID0_9CHLR|nr:hypothetical protein [Chloroflexus islandicus]OAN48471.1 hypothetical protein A6A03_07755 [Chloroflexus islandicus]